jgi:hypothetical protein
MNIEVLPLCSIVRRLPCTVLRPRILPFFVATVVLIAVLATVQVSREALGNERPRLTVAQKKIVRHFEKQLKTRLHSKDNPADRDTWYVIVFTDSAVGTRKSRSVSGNIRTTTYALHATGDRAVRVTQGRKNAALLLLQYYYYTGNVAAARLKPAANGKTLRAGAIATKNWRYWAFAEEEKAKAFYDLLDPKKKGKRTNGG